MIALTLYLLGYILQNGPVHYLVSQRSASFVEISIIKPEKVLSMQIIVGC